MTSYWLLVRNGRKGREVLTRGLLEGSRRTLPIFSFEEEAEMFLWLRRSKDGWRVRETTAGELLSMLYTVLKGVECVALDPIPENSCLDTSGLLSITRQDFIDRLERANGGEVAAEKVVLGSPATREYRHAQRAG